MGEEKGNTDMAGANTVVGADKEGRAKSDRRPCRFAHQTAAYLLGMSQERLGEALGLTFQQVQKYERGVNRVGASRLFDLSRVLDVPISFFFDDMPESLAGTYGGHLSRRSAGFSEMQDGSRRCAEPARDAGTGARLLPHHRSLGAQARVRPDQVDGSGRSLTVFGSQLRIVEARVAEPVQGVAQGRP